MSAEIRKEIQLEIAHVLFIDIVGYSKLSINEQRAAVDELNEVVRASEQFQKAEAAARLIKIPTGDGMALVFYTSPEAPAQCAVEISRALKEHPRLQLRMGVHSGPVSGVIDVKGHANLAGAGLNIARRVMECGDAGHILLSKHVAEDLEEYEQWRPLLHDLGTCEVKHGVRIGIANLYDSEVGNPQLPKKLQAIKKHRSRVRWAGMAVALLMLAAIVAAFVFLLRRPTRSALAIPEKSVAVLPFENLSADLENAFFADGVQDEILNDLAKIADLKVISRTSVMQYKSGAKRNLRQIANELGVAHVVEGSVQRAGNRVRVSAQLIDAKTDTHLWVERYDRPLDDVFGIQSEIAKAIATQLQAKLSPAEKAAIEQPPTTDLVAYDRYVRAKKLKEDAATPRIFEHVRQTIQLLNQAVAHDPTFLLAYCELARAHAYLYFLGTDHTPARVALAIEARDAALRLGPDRAETHLAAAWVAYHCYLDYETALTEVAIARRGLPNDASIFDITAFITRRQGQWEQCTRNLERAAELDPRSMRLLVTGAADTYQFMRRFSDMAAALDRALVVAPGDANTRVARAFVDLKSRADTGPAHKVIQNIVLEDPSAVYVIAEQWLDLALCRRDAAEMASALASLSREGIVPFNVRMSRSFCAGLAARARNEAASAEIAFTAARGEMEKIVREQPDYAQALCVLGMIDAALGRKEDALHEGRRAVELLPVTKDAWTGAAVLTDLAITYAWAGEIDLAIEQLEELVRIPSPVSYGQLRLHPFWDPLRGDPRFEKIVASLAPKETAPNSR
jgi:TolB-like protein